MILHGSPLAMAAVEGPSHIVRDVNDAFCRLVCKDREALLGHPFSEVDPQWASEKDCIALLDRVYRTHAAETLADEAQFSFAGVEPAYWSYWAWVSPVPAGSGEHQLVGVVVQVMDTTADQKFRQMGALMNPELIVSSIRLLSEQTVAMAQAAKAKDVFLAMLGHELRNPLSAISNAVKLVEMRTVGQDNLQKPVAIMIRQVRHLARLVDDLMDVSRITHGKMEVRKEPVDLCATARRAVEVAQHQMDLSGCTVSVSVPAEPIWLDGDSARLEQIFGNLLNNAAKYTEPGGSVLLTVRREDGDAVIKVADTGIGITPEMLPRVFDIFFQEGRSVSRSRGGLGLGLSLVKTLTELHGGTVAVESAGLGLGSVFTVRLPVIPQNDANTGTGASQIDDKSSLSLRILLVEDDINVALPLASILELWGHTVRVVHDGLSAVEAAWQDIPDTVLLDLGLPVMDGYEVARTLRATKGLEGLRIVALTGYGSESNRRLTREAGFDEHLVKPIDFARLRIALTPSEALA